MVSVRPMRAWAALAIFASTTAFWGCERNPGQVQVYGRVLDPGAPASPSIPQPELRLTYELILELESGTTRSARYEALTDGEGQFLIQEPWIGEPVAEPVIATRSRLSYRRLPLESDWVVAETQTAEETVEQTENGISITRSETLTLPQALLSVGTSFASLLPSPGAPPLIAENENLILLEETNQLWSQCGIALVPLEQIQFAPSEISLSHTPTIDDFDEVFSLIDATRARLRHQWPMPILSTGPFLDAGSTIGVTYSYGDFGWGVVIPSTSYSYHSRESLLAHEVGHYLGLDHTQENHGFIDDGIADTTPETVGAGNLMKWIIERGEAARTLTPGQCQAAREHLANLGSQVCRPWEGIGCALRDAPGVSSGGLTLPGAQIPRGERRRHDARSAEPAP